MNKKSKRMLSKPSANQRVKIWPHDSPHTVACKEAWNSLVDAFENREPVGFKEPIFHMEAGNRCFDQRVPEEINRRIVDHTADINLTYSNIARDYLLREGLPPDQIIKIGNISLMVLAVMDLHGTCIDMRFQSVVRVIQFW